jgi:outer membrane biosynthesis protein TonB
MSDASLDKLEQRNKIIGYAGTAIVHALLLLLLWWLVLSPPNPPIEYGGMGLTMALGEENMGGPSDVPVTDPSVPEPTPPIEEAEQPVATQEVEEAPAVVAPKEVKKVEVKKPIKKPVEKPVEQPRKPDEKSLFKKRNNTADASGRGDGDAPGNQGAADGDPNGDPNGNGYGNGGTGSGTGAGNGTGPGNGDGITYELKGRSLARKPNIEDNSKETGKVVVSIVVDKSGKVTKAMPNQRGTTTLSPILLAKAKQAALDTRFSPNPNAPEEQFGTITIVFKFRP